MLDDDRVIIVPGNGGVGGKWGITIVKTGMTTLSLSLRISPPTDLDMTNNDVITGEIFLAPIGAQGVTMSVCPSVRLSVRDKFV